MGLRVAAVWFVLYALGQIVHLPAYGIVLAVVAAVAGLLILMGQ